MRKSFEDLRSSFIILSIILIISSVGIGNSLNSLVYSHDFVPNESALFISFISQLETELDLAQANLADRNVSLAEEHIAQAVGLLNSNDPINNITWKEEITERNQRVANELVAVISAIENMTVLQSSPSSPSSMFTTELNQSVDERDAIIEEVITSRIDREHLTNGTVQATALGDIMNTLLGHYGSAYSVGFDMGNMSQMAAGMKGASNKSYSLVNVSEYQSAQALVNKALEKFDSELRILASANKTDSVGKLGESLNQLSNLIDNKSSPFEVMEIGHTQVHPNLQAAFDLRLQMTM